MFLVGSPDQNLFRFCLLIDTWSVLFTFKRACKISITSGQRVDRNGNKGEQN